MRKNQETQIPFESIILVLESWNPGALTIACTQGSGLSKLLEGQSGERQDIILLRLITCHAIALSPNNRSKLEGLVRLLLDRMGAVASAPQVDMDSLDSAVKAVQMLCSKMPDFTIQGLSRNAILRNFPATVGNDMHARLPICFDLLPLLRSSLHCTFLCNAHSKRGKNLLHCAQSCQLR